VRNDRLTREAPTEARQLSGTARLGAAVAAAGLVVAFGIVTVMAHGQPGLGAGSHLQPASRQAAETPATPAPTPHLLSPLPTPVVSTGIPIHAPPAPAACPAPPAGVSGAQLYWEPVASQIKTPFAQPQLLCGSGFFPSERVTVSIEVSGSVGSAPDGLPEVAAVANSAGAFSVPAGAVALPPCGFAGGAGQVVAHGDRGSSASATLPPPLPTGCASTNPG
jgi:hypothetical protein